MPKSSSSRLAITAQSQFSPDRPLSPLARVLSRHCSNRGLIIGTSAAGDEGELDFDPTRESGAQIGTNQLTAVVEKTHVPALVAQPAFDRTSLEIKLAVRRER